MEPATIPAAIALVVMICGSLWLIFKPSQFNTEPDLGVPMPERQHSMTPSAQAVLLRNMWHAHIEPVNKVRPLRNPELDRFPPGAFIKVLEVFDERSDMFKEAPVLFERAMNAEERGRMKSTLTNVPVETPDSVVWIVGVDGIPRTYFIDSRRYQLDDTHNIGQ